MLKITVLLISAIFIISMQACYTRHKVEVAPMEVKPIHITIDVNVRVDRALDNFFEDLDRAAAETPVPSSSGN